MLSAEEQFFLTVLADHLNGRPTALVPGLDWKSLRDMALRHQVAAIFYAQCGAFMPPEAELLFGQDYCAAVADYAARQKIAAEIDRAFTRHRIPYVPLKGLVVAESYPQPELRTMGDIDILVRHEDKERAHAVLLENGGQGSHQGDHEWFYRKDSWKIELHHRLLYDDPFNAPEDVAFCKKIWEYVSPVPDSSRCELDPDFHFLFLVLHLKKHIIYSGAGFRQFMDLAVAARKWPLNWIRFRSWLAELDLLSFTQTGLTFCRNWFGMVLPLESENMMPESVEEAARQIFHNGVFGDRNEARTGELFRRPWIVLFPGYDTMHKQERYRFLEGKPWLLPGAWFYRIGLVLCNRHPAGWIPMFASAKVRRRNKMLKKMGL